MGSLCGKGPKLPPPPAPINWRVLAPDAQIYYDNGVGFGDSVRVVVRDAAAWQNLWTQATKSQPSPPPRPQVDFATQMLLLVAAGRMKPGDEIHVDSIGVRADTTYVVVKTTLACQQFPTDAFPVEVVRIRRSEGPVMFAERVFRSTACR